MMKVAIVVFLLGNVCAAVEIKEFQPSVVPVRFSTRLTIVTANPLNSSAAIRCRFGDMSVPAEVNDGLVFCDTPPVRDTDKAALHLDIDGKLFKAKRPLRFHEPFKVTDISPKSASPAQLLQVKISGIKCETWMHFFVRFQTANATKATQEGVCNNATVMCYVPEFPANTLLRVGVTLSNRIVEWSPSKLRIQYPIDAVKSSLQDLIADTTKRGAFDFKVILKDKFRNHIHLTKDHVTDRALSVQYTPFEKATSFQFIKCDISTTPEKAGSVYSVRCAGAEYERILVYPSINNVPVGDRESYEVTTTLCPGKFSCHEKSSQTTMIIIVCSVIGAAVLLGSAAFIYRLRHHGFLLIQRKRKTGGNKMLPGTVEDLPLPNCAEISHSTRTTKEDKDCISLQTLKDNVDEINSESSSDVGFSAGNAYKTDCYDGVVNEGNEMKEVIKEEKTKEEMPYAVENLA